jgi:hypothetical protein
MEWLLMLVIGGAVLVALSVRRSITPVAARRILALAAMGTVVFGLGLFLLLTGRLAPINLYAWAWILAGFFLLSLAAAPFGLIPLFLRADGGAEEPLVD